MMPALLLISFINCSFAASFFVKSLKAPVLSEAKAGSTSLTTLARGEKVEGLKSENSFVQVSHSGKTGWINKLFLSDKPIEGKESLLNQEIDISSKARKRASSFTSAAAARGLKEDSDEIFKNLGDAANAESLKIMEKFKVDEVKGQSFIADPKEGL